MLASIILMNCFPLLLNVINGDSLHPNHLLSALRPLLRFQFCISPSVKDLREHHHQRHSCPLLRDTAAGVKPLDLPGFMLPWRLCVHVSRLCEATHPVDELICAVQVIHRPTHTVPFLVLLLLMRVTFLKMLIQVKSVSLNQRLIAGRAVVVAVN